ncbi:MAG: MarC family protein [Desulfobulbales bacterium]
MKIFLLCFVPLFVAFDALCVLPIYIGLTGDLPPTHKRRVLVQSLITASAVAFIFLVLGPTILNALNITVSDFMVAGGLMLLVISLNDLLTGEKRQRQVDPETLGAVPLGVHLITGPAVLTTSVLLANAYGIPFTAIALLLNLAIAGTIFRFAQPITRFLGHAGTMIVSKIASLFLATIAVMLIRKGVVAIMIAALK